MHRKVSKSISVKEQGQVDDKKNDIARDKLIEEEIAAVGSVKEILKRTEVKLKPKS